jgi:hypothetical protein
VGGMMTVDPALLELAERGTAYRVPAATLARMQHNISRDLGHVVALNDTILWRHIVIHANKGKIPASTARCMRCGAPATLTDWITNSQLRQAARGMKYHHMKQAQGEIAARFLAICRGERHAEWTMEALESYGREAL